MKICTAIWRTKRGLLLCGLGPNDPIHTKAPGHAYNSTLAVHETHLMEFAPSGGLFCLVCELYSKYTRKLLIEPCTGSVLRAEYSKRDPVPHWIMERVERLQRGDWSFGHGGRHLGRGTDDCPRSLHHHHDNFCNEPTYFELIMAGIRPEEFVVRSRE